MLPKISNSSLSWVLIIVLALIWGGSFVLMKEALLVFTPYQIGALRMAIAFLAFLPLTVFIFRKIPADKWKYIAVSGLVGNLLPSFLFPMAQTSLSSSVTGILNALTPLFTLLVGIALFKTALKKRQVAGLLLGFAGACSLSLLKNDGSIGSVNYHVVYVILATLCYGISINVVRQYLGGIKPIYVAACALSSTSPFSLTYLFSTDFIYRMQTVPQAPTALFYLCILGMVGSAFALVLFNKLVQISSAVQASMTTYLIPIVALFWGWVAGETLTIWHFLGMILIVSGVYVVNKQ
jgi:drug/metabolite transporter (DMT)-like permease